MLLLHHIFLTLVIADVARFIPVHISSMESPSEEMIDTRYLIDVASSRRSPSINTVVLGLLFFLLFMILVFSALISILYARLGQCHLRIGGC